MTIHTIYICLFWIYVFIVFDCNCLTSTLTPVDPEIIEGNDITLTCTVSSRVSFVNWNLELDLITYTTSMTAKYYVCSITPLTMLSDTTKYSYDCNFTVYQVTVNNVQRSEHNGRWSCIPAAHTSGPTSTIKVQGPVKYVTLAPAETTINVIENSAIDFTCKIPGARPEATVTWYKVEAGKISRIYQNITFNTTDDDFSVTTSTLSFVPSRQQEGIKIYCDAKNRHNVAAVKSEHEVEIIVLFPPVVGTLSNISIVEGSRLDITCPYTPGNPEDTSVKWSHNTNGQIEYSKRLIISSIDKEDAGRYTCTASNTMVTYAGNTHTAEDNNSFHLEVFYVVITSFTIDEQNTGPVTVNENDEVRFKSVADGIPSPIIRLTNSHGDLKTDTTQTLNYTIDKAKCSDADTYTCSANVQHNVEVSVKSLQLYVRCRPRSADIVLVDRKCEKDASVTFTFNAIAYPSPTFTWWRFDADTIQWSKLNNFEDTVIKSSDLQSNLTIRKVTLKYFTRYKLEIQNYVGAMTQMYTLSPYDKPELPTKFRHREDLTTATSIGLSWKPGFNGGLPQTFHIKYKKSTTSTWRYVNVYDIGEDIIQYILTDLTQNTQYDIIIYASNIKGKSEESPIVVAFTKEDTNNIASVIGYSFGATSGGFILVLLSVYLVWRFRSKRADDDKQGVSSRDDRVTTEEPAVESGFYEPVSDTQSSNLRSTGRPVYYNEARDTQNSNVCPTGDAVYYNEANASNYERLEMQNRDVSNYSDLSDLTSDHLYSKVVYEDMTL